MLKQILKDMFVDPDILAELPEEQKQILFFKIREEQKRRYDEREREYEKKGFKKAGKKSMQKQGATRSKVRIMEDTNGQPWTWVMGEHPNDIPIEEIWANLGNENYKSQRRDENNVPVSKVQALIFAKNKALQRDDPEAKKPDQIIPNRNENNNANRVSQTVVAGSNKTNSKEAPEHKIPKPVARKPAIPSKHENIKPQVQSKPPITPGLTSELPPEIPPRSPANNRPIAPAPLVEKGDLVPPPPAANGSTTSIRPTKTETAEKDSEEENVYEGMDELADSLPVRELEEKEWKNQLRRFKAADEQRKFHARRASMEVRRLSQKDLNRGQKLQNLRDKFHRKRSQRELKSPLLEERPALPPKPTNLRPKHPATRPGRSPKPSTRSELQEWFKETQTAEILASADDNNALPVWFHGIISRNVAESMLEDKNVGDFLIRVSEKIWGYALSYKDENKIKHFLIDGSEPDCYHFFGNDQIRHPGLEQLIAFHQDEAISYGGEMLKNGVGQVDTNNPDYSDLFENLTPLKNVNDETRETAL